MRKRVYSTRISKSLFALSSHCAAADQLLRSALNLIDSYYKFQINLNHSNVSITIWLNYIENFSISNNHKFEYPNNYNSRKLPIILQIYWKTKLHYYKLSNRKNVIIINRILIINVINRKPIIKTSVWLFHLFIQRNKIIKLVGLLIKAGK